MNARRVCVQIAAAGALLLTVGVPSASAQSEIFQGSTTLDRIVSPSVVSTYVTRGKRLALLVLWRGTPGWFKTAGTGDGSGSTATGGFYEQTLTIADGSLNLKVQINHTDGTAQLAGHRVSIFAHNVVLVDYVDSASGPEVADTIWIEPGYANAPDPLRALIERAPQLADFLKCDAVVPNPLALSGFATVCHRLIGR